MSGGASQSDMGTYQYLADHPEIFEAIGQAVGDPLRIQKRLREGFPDDAVRLALTIAELRNKAARRGFPHSEGIWFDRTRLEQATAWPVAVHKAARFSGRTYDFCCGAGVDALALAEHAEVVALDVDPLACLLTELNATLFGVRDRIEIRRQPVEESTARDGLLHVDPDRRQGAAGRAVRIEDYVPSIESLRRFTREFPGGAIKISPAANFGGKFDDVEIELVSLHGECKEATIWFGALAGARTWRATALPSGATIAGDPLAAEPRLAALGRYLYDPDPALVRAGLIDLFCEEAGIARLDLAEEYLTSEELIKSPFATAFRVLAEVPNNLRTLKRTLREIGSGVLEIKARRLPINIARMDKTLPRDGDRPLVVLFCRIAAKSRIVIAERV